MTSADTNADALFFTNSLQVPALQQQRKETLCEIFRVVCFYTLASHKGKNGPPICSAKFLERFLRCRRFSLRSQHYAPLRSGKVCVALLECVRNPFHRTKSTQKAWRIACRAAGLPAVGCHSYCEFPGLAAVVRRSERGSASVVLGSKGKRICFMTPMLKRH